MIDGRRRNSERFPVELAQFLGALKHAAIHHQARFGRADEILRARHRFGPAQELQSRHESPIVLNRTVSWNRESCQALDRTAIQIPGIARISWECYSELSIPGP